MADTRYLKQRFQTWYFTIAIPRDLRSRFGKARIEESLKTRDLSVAQSTRWAKREHYEALFRQPRSGDPLPVTAQPVAPEVLLEIDEFARTIYREALATMAADARNGVRAWAQPELDALHHELTVCYFNNDFAPVAQPLAAYREQKGLAPGSLTYTRLGEALIAARMWAVSGRKDALEDQPSEEPSTFLGRAPVDPVTLKPFRTSARSGRLVFAEVAARFIAERQRDPAYKLTEQTRGQYEAAYRLFDRWAKQPTLDTVDRRKASDFLDAIASLNPRWGRGPGVKKLSFAEIADRFGGHTPGLSAKTINRYAMALKMVWDFAEDRDGYEGKNPWTGQMRPTSKRRGNSETDKRGFTPAELKSLLAHKPKVAPAEHDTETALPWLTLISAYSGMRLNEICEIDVEDVKETGGILFFDLTKAKTEAGVRVVPIHSEIIAAGFRNYVANNKAGPLWPGLKPGGPDKKKSWYVSKRFTEYRRTLKLSDIDKTTGRDRLDFHSLRRSAITALKNAHIPEHDAAEVVGHEHPRVTFGVYPDRHRLGRLQAIVEAIRYD